MAIINTVVALGMFDGLHLGHREILDKTLEVAKERNLLSVATTFSDKIIEKDIKKDGFLYQESMRVEMLTSYGFQMVEKFSADDNFLSMTKDVFLHKFVNKFHPKAIVLGKDFTFGAKGQGNAEYLKFFFAKTETEVIVLPLKEQNGIKISTSTIKDFLRLGNIKEANKLLGAPFFLSGIIERGRGAGKQNDIPTANFNTFPLQILPKNGVYRTHTLVDGQEFVSLTNVGTHPTYDDMRQNVETHLLGFSGTLYGKEIKVKFLNRLRDIYKFSSKEALKEQILRDIEEVNDDEIRSRG